VGFRLLDGEKAAKVRAAKAEIEKQNLDETAKALAIAFLYRENGLTAEAIALLESLAASPTKTVSIHRQLGNLYWDYLSLAAEASQHYQQAAALAEPERLELLAEAKDKLGQFEEERGNIDKAIELFAAAREYYIGPAEKLQTVEPVRRSSCADMRS
jgi:tetratricopeptide (TPR) repeat protein